MPIYLALSEVKVLSDSLGKTIAFEKEYQFDEAVAMACLNGWMYRFFDEQVNWLIAQGIDAEDARQIVLQNTVGARIML